MIIRNYKKIIGFILILSIFTLTGIAQKKGISHIIGKNHITVVPETLLRGYDPITVFFPSSEGPLNGGPLDKPDKFLKIYPKHPGEYKWLDNKTLQFSPTIAWPALQQFTITVKGYKFKLVTLMAPPTRISPSNRTENLEPVKEITLTFANRIGVKRLSMMLCFEIRPIPGMERGVGSWLTNKDFVIKEIERSTIKKAVKYQVTLHKPIPYGSITTLHLRLSMDDSISGSLASYSFSTKPLFRIKAIGSGSTVYPVSLKGSVYSIEQAMDCSTGKKPIFIEFSDTPGAISLNQIKRMIHFEPSVKNFHFNVSGKKVRLYFDIQREKIYKLLIQHIQFKNSSGRLISPFGEISFYFFYRKSSPYLKWLASQGILECYGPQLLPMEGRNMEQVDLRIYKIDPLNRNFWPFSSDPIAINESTRPRGPGEEPKYATQIIQQIKLLGSPLVSRIVPLPFKTGSGKVKFGLDLKKLMAKISGKNKPGTYLVGYRTIGSSTTRYYTRIQVTNLCLSTVEEESAVTFVVTSLKSGEPIKGAKIQVHGYKKGKWGKVISGITDNSGKYRYIHYKRIDHQIRRIVVSKEEDRLVLDPNSPPPHFLNNHWYNSYNTWLSWLNQNPRNIKLKSVHKAHILTERPVYRPDEPVHIKGYVRLRKQGKIILDSQKRLRSVKIDGPGGKRWTYPVKLNSYGSFYIKFDEKDLPTGNYYASICDDKDNNRMDIVSFKKESYRIPRFEVKLSGPDRVPQDAPFKLYMTAAYYAGGRVVGQEVSWHVTKFHYRFHFKKHPGYLFSSDERFGGTQHFRSLGSQTKEDITDDNGSAFIEIDPTTEKDSQPKRYVVEVTVRGADEQSVTTTKSILALPPFVLGLKMARFMKSGTIIKPKIIILDHNGKIYAGRKFHLRLLQRQWHSHLRKSDFTTGKAKYVTDVVDEQIFEKDYVSEAGEKTIKLTVKESGVYVVEISATDNMGRVQKVFADLYLAGETPMAWKKPKSNVFETSLDKKIYDPGDKASILLKSPFQNAHALVIVEGPVSNTYHWVRISSGQGVFVLPITANMNPRVPVHILLMRGRLSIKNKINAKPKKDRGKPISMANTTWVNVRPKTNQLNIALKHKKKHLPGQTCVMTVLLTDPDNKPLNGEVTLWLVDRAVLALGKEKALDPLPSFIEIVNTMLRIRGTRNEVVGDLILEELIGGGVGAIMEKRLSSLFKHVTVRKLFKSVPYFNPNIRVINGKAKIKIKLPENLTDFAIRAVATDGHGRFGAYKSMLSIRLPLIIQSALPRFVRPGDSFVAGGIGRVVEGDPGPGRAELQVEGLKVRGNTKVAISWVKDKPEKIYFPLKVPLDIKDIKDKKVCIRLAVKRDNDGAMDAFEVHLPVRKDKEMRRVEKFINLKSGQTIGFPFPKEKIRPGSINQTMLLTCKPELVKMLAGLNFLARYEHGCTEQRISKLLPELALKDVLSHIGRGSRSKEMTPYMKETLSFLETTIQSNGLYSCWPGSRGYVSLTAYVVDFLVLARNQGYKFKDALLNRAVSALKDSLRSDYSNFIDGYSFVERAEALAALSNAGYFDQSYAYDLMTRAINMDLYIEAKILYTFLDKDKTNKKAIERLSKDLFKSLVFKLRNGKEVYQGLQYRSRSWGGLILSSEVKTLANVARSLYHAQPSDKRIKLLMDELISRGIGDGWGSTNANASAILALGEILKNNLSSKEKYEVKLSFGNKIKEIDTMGKVVTRISNKYNIPGKIRLTKGIPDSNQPLLVWFYVDYMPAGTGDRIRARNKGFVVERELLVYKSMDKPPIRNKVVPGKNITIDIGTIVEDHIRVINSKHRYYVAIKAPFAAGFEPMNPILATSPKEAKPDGIFTKKPDYSIYSDDSVTFYFDSLPKGTYDFYFRLKASIEGRFTHPAAKAEMMYKLNVCGNSDGLKIIVRKRLDNE